MIFVFIQCDPYIRIALGRKSLDDREHYKPNTLNPEFGRWDSNVCSSLNFLLFFYFIHLFKIIFNIKEKQIHYFLSSIFFNQDVWAVLLLASRQGPEDCCVWLWLTEQRWESGWDHHRFGEQTPVSFQVLLWPATDLLCVSMPALCTQWTHTQKETKNFCFNVFIFMKPNPRSHIFLSVQASISGETSWSPLRSSSVWLKLRASLLHA